jgi:hypothetical protein
LQELRRVIGRVNPIPEGKIKQKVSTQPQRVEKTILLPVWTEPKLQVEPEIQYN